MLSDGHHLDAADDVVVKARGRRLDVAQHAVDAQPLHDAVGTGLDVNVGGARRRGMGDEPVDVADDRLLAGQIGEAPHVVGRGGSGARCRHAVWCRRAGAAAVEALERARPISLGTAAQGSTGRPAAMRTALIV